MAASLCGPCAWRLPWLSLSFLNIHSTQIHDLWVWGFIGALFGWDIGASSSVVRIIGQGTSEFGALDPFQLGLLASISLFGAMGISVGHRDHPRARMVAFPVTFTRHAAPFHAIGFGHSRTFCHQALHEEWLQVALGRLGLYALCSPDLLAGDLARILSRHPAFLLGL